MPYHISGPQCSELDCNRPVFERGWCRRHYDLAAAFGWSALEVETWPEFRAWLARQDRRAA